MSDPLKGNKTQYRYLLLHILCWSVVIIAPLFFHSSENSWTQAWARYARALGAPLSCMIVFYLNFLWLVPRYLVKNKDWKIFIALNILVLVLGVLFTDVWRWTNHQLLSDLIDFGNRGPLHAFKVTSICYCGTSCLSRFRWRYACISDGNTWKRCARK